MKQVESKVLTADDKKVNKEFQKELEFCRHCDAEIDKNLTRKGESLLRIREEKLYRVHYKTFEEAIVGELKISRQEGYRLIEDVATVKNLKLSPKGDKIVQDMDLKTKHIRALSATTDDAESQIQVLEHIQKNELPLTAKTIEQVADEILPPKVEQKPSKPEPVEPAPTESPWGKQTEFNPDKLEAASQAAKVVDKTRDAFASNLAKLKAALQTIIDGLGPTVRALDDCESAKTISNHKHLLEQHRAFYKHVEGANNAMKVYSAAWAKSEVKDAK